MRQFLTSTEQTIRPVYLVFDTGCTAYFEPTTDRGLAQSHFNEAKQDGKDARMLVYYGNEPTGDLTSDAVELAARDWLESVGPFDLPQWVLNTDAHDDWVKEEARNAREFRREYDHQRALRANL